jgi:anti-sigma factor RsiW
MTRRTPDECAAVLASISAYLDGDLDAAACASIEAHAVTCATCAPTIEGLRRTIGLCHDAGAVPLPDVVRQRARASIQQLLDADLRTRGKWK